MNLIHSNVFNRLFDTFDGTFGNDFPTSFDKRTMHNQNGLINLAENENSYIFSAELPGFEKKDIQISVHANRLEIIANRTIEYDKEDQVYRYERKAQSFKRSLNLPNKVNTEKVTAELVNGLLTIELQKTDSDQQKKIEIN